MFTRKFVDYTILPVGKATRKGMIRMCERCGKPGLYVTCTKFDVNMEKWIHIQQIRLINPGPVVSCTRTEKVMRGKAISSWGWSHIE